MVLDVSMVLTKVLVLVELLLEEIVIGVVEMVETAKEIMEVIQIKILTLVQMVMEQVVVLVEETILIQEENLL